MLTSNYFHYITLLTPVFGWFSSLLSMLKIPITKKVAIRSNHHHHHHHQTTNCPHRQLFAGEQEGQGQWGEVADMTMIVGMVKQQHQGGGRGEEENEEEEETRVLMHPR